MATRIVCNHTCTHNYKNWCSKDKIELIWIPPMAVTSDSKEYEGSMACLDKKPVKSKVKKSIEGLVAQSE